MKAKYKTRRGKMVTTKINWSNHFQVPQGYMKRILDIQECSDGCSIVSKVEYMPDEEILEENVYYNGELFIITEPLEPLPTSKWKYTLVRVNNKKICGFDIIDIVLSNTLKESYPYPENQLLESFLLPKKEKKL
jgi:hypothetical protein